MNWSPADVETLRRHYPSGGSPAVIPLLSIERTRDQVNKAAKRRGIKCYRRDQVNVGCPWRRWNGPRELDRTARPEAQREISK